MILTFNVQVHDDLTFEFIGTTFKTDVFLSNPDDLLQYEGIIFDFIQPNILGIYSKTVGIYDVEVELQLVYTYCPPPKEGILLADKILNVISITKVGGNT